MEYYGYLMLIDGSSNSVCKQFLNSSSSSKFIVLKKKRNHAQSQQTNRLVILAEKNKLLGAIESDTLWAIGNRSSPEPAKKKESKLNKP